MDRTGCSARCCRTRERNPIPTSLIADRERSGPPLEPRECANDRAHPEREAGRSSRTTCRAPRARRISSPGAVYSEKMSPLRSGPRSQRLIVAQRVAGQAAGAWNTTVAVTARDPHLYADEVKAIVDELDVFEGAAVRFAAATGMCPPEWGSRSPPGSLNSPPQCSALGAWRWAIAREHGAAPLDMFWGTREART